MNPLQLVLMILSGGVGVMGIGWLLLKQFGWWSVSLFLSIMIVLALVGLGARFYRKRSRKKLTPEQRDAEQAKVETSRENAQREHLVLAAIAAAFRLLKDHMQGDAYRLPLYLMIGPEGAGKTMLLKSFGLVRIRSPELELAAEYLEVWCSEQLVVIKLWGRLYEQTGGESDVQLWERTMRRLLRERPRRCLNGILVTLPVSLMTSASSDEREEQSVFLRRRLRETGFILGQKLPVYMFVTQCDRLAGFAGAFRMALAGETEQCFGALMEDSRLNHYYQRDWFEKSWGELRTYIESRMSLALNEENEASHRADVVTLSWQLQLLAPQLAEVMDAVFRSGPLGMALHFRGYFLVGRGGDIPTEDLLASYLNSRYGFVGIPEQSVVAGSSALFTRGLLAGVLLPESGLAGRNMTKVWWWRFGGAAWVAASLALVLLCGSWFFGNLDYVRNRGEVMIEAWNELQQPPPTNNNITDIVSWLTSLQAVVNNYQRPVPWYISSWFIQHGQGRVLQKIWEQRLATYLRPALLRWLENAVLDHMDQRRSDRSPTYIQLYFALTGQPNLKLSSAALEQVVSNILGTPNVSQEKAFTEQLITLMNHPGSTAERDEVFIDKLRNSWLRYGDAAVFLRNMAALAGFRSIPLTQVFSREFLAIFELDPTLLDDGFPVMYTAKTASQMNFQVSNEAVKLYLALRQAIFHPQYPTISLAEQQLAMQGMWEVYFQRYGEFWQKLLASLTLRPVTTNEQLSYVLQKLGTPGESPLENLVRVVTMNTQLDTRMLKASGPGHSVVGSGNTSETVVVDQALQQSVQQPKAAQEVEEKSSLVNRVFKKNTVKSGTGSPPPALVQGLARQFADYSRLTVVGQDSSELSALTQQLNHYYSAVQSSMQGVEGDKTALKLMTAYAEGDSHVVPWPSRAVNRLPEALRRLMQNVQQQSAGILLQGAARHINRAWRDEVLPVWQEQLERTYPFSSSGKDADLSAFTGFFAKGGTLDAFTASYLKAFSTTRQEADGSILLLPLTVDDAVLPLVPSLWQQLTRAADIRRLFFGQNNRLGMDLSVRVAALSPTVTQLRLDADSGVLINRHGPSEWKTFPWNGTSPDFPLVLSFFSDDLLLAEHSWHGPWRWLRWLEAGRTTPMGYGDFRLDLKLRDYQAEFIVRPPGQKLPGDLLGQFHLPEQLK